MNESVLVAAPYRVGVSAHFLRNTEKQFKQLSFKRKELILFPNDYAPDGRKYGQHAQARNALIDSYLRPDHTHVLWVDIDLVSMPADLIERLLGVDSQAIVAPFVYVEMINPAGAVSMSNGGWFYDTGGFKRNGTFAMEFAPHFSDMPNDAIEMDSVGCCYLVPAWLYREGLLYAPNALDVEHLSFCKQAAEKGVKIFADPRIRVEHAYLPKYGEAWHG